MTRTRIETKKKQKDPEQAPTTLVDDSNETTVEEAADLAAPAEDGNESAEAVAKSHELVAADDAAEAKDPEANRELTPEERFELQWATVHAGMPDPPELPTEQDAVIVCTYHRTDGLRTAIASTEREIAGVGIDIEELARTHREERDAN